MEEQKSGERGIYRETVGDDLNLIDSTLKTLESVSNSESKDEEKSSHESNMSIRIKESGNLDNLQAIEERKI